jgi:hypothetical protein
MDNKFEGVLFLVLNVKIHVRIEGDRNHALEAHHFWWNMNTLEAGIIEGIFFVVAVLLSMGVVQLLGTTLQRDATISTVRTATDKCNSCWSYVPSRRRVPEPC